MLSVKRHIAAFGALMVTSLILAAPAVRLELTRTLLPDGGHSQWSSSRCGVTEITPGHFEISSDGQCVRPAVGCRLRIAPGCSHVRVSSSVQLSGATPGDQVWDRPLLSLAWTDDSMEIVDYSARIFPKAHGSADLGQQSQLFAVPHDATTAVLRFVMAAASGSMVLHDISVAAFRARSGIAVAQYFALMLWGILFAVAGKSLLSGCRRSWLKPVIACTAVLIVIGATLPRRTVPWPALNRLGTTTVQSSANETDETPQPVNTGGGAGTVDHALELRMDRNRIANVGHVLAFMVLALALAAAGPRGGFPMIATALVAFAAATEIIQGFTPERTPAVADFSLDLAGAAVALLLAAAAAWLRGRKPRPQIG